MQHVPMLKRGGSQQGHVMLAVLKKWDRTKRANIRSELEQQEDHEDGAQQFGC